MAGCFQPTGPVGGQCLAETTKFTILEGIGTEGRTILLGIKLGIEAGWDAVPTLIGRCVSRLVFGIFPARLGDAMDGNQGSPENLISFL